MYVYSTMLKKKKKQTEVLHYIANISIDYTMTGGGSFVSAYNKSDPIVYEQKE